MKLKQETIRKYSMETKQNKLKYLKNSSKNQRDTKKKVKKY